MSSKLTEALTAGDIREKLKGNSSEDAKALLKSIEGFGDRTKVHIREERWLNLTARPQAGGIQQTGSTPEELASSETRPRGGARLPADGSAPKAKRAAEGQTGTA